MCIFFFAVIWVVIFNVQNQYVTGFQFVRICFEIIQIYMAYFQIFKWKIDENKNPVQLKIKFVRK